MGLTAGQVVLEIGYADDADQEPREGIVAITGKDLVEALTLPRTAPPCDSGASALPSDLPSDRPRPYRARRGLRLRGTRVQRRPPAAEALVRLGKSIPDVEGLPAFSA
ncbi:DUF3052 family protein [Streptomyces sp. NBC_01511]|uniref:DUF3052 family protein n=1 Tax=Streptomyces sp. NBC_01511 TaxID=2903889 RepID=UPI0038667B93